MTMPGTYQPEAVYDAGLQSCHHNFAAFEILQTAHLTQRRRVHRVQAPPYDFRKRAP